MSGKFAQIKKLDDELQILYAEVYVPDIPDSQGDFATVDEVRKMAHRFLASGRVGKIDRQHDNKETGSIVVESFVAREGDPDFIIDAWVVGIHVPDKALWKDVKDHKINGLSFEGFVHKRPRVIELEIPSKIEGVTKIGADEEPHDHKFVVRFDEKGNFLGGRAMPGEGAANHPHVIRNASVTEEGGVDKHKHRYGFLEVLVDAQS